MDVGNKTLRRFDCSEWRISPRDTDPTGPKDNQTGFGESPVETNMLLEFTTC